MRLPCPTAQPVCRLVIQVEDPACDLPVVAASLALLL
jgi:hypothetical protein